MQSQTVEQPGSERGGIGVRAGDRDWPVLAGLGLIVVLLLALGFTVSGAGRTSSGNLVAAATPGAQVLPAGVAVACGAGQQALLKQVDNAGQPLVQVECVPVAGLAGASAFTTGYAPGTMVVGSMGSATARAIPAVYTPANDDVVYRPPARRTVVERRSGRSWQKSAVIIGSSAGIGAGVGAAIGGKKGALIGAAVGGGSAAIWDQVTRNRR